MRTQKPRDRKRHLVYGRILMTFVAIVVLIDGLAVGIFLSGSRIVNRQARDAILSQIEFSMGQLVGAVERMYALQVDLVNDDRFERIAVLPESLTGYDRIRIFLDVETRLTGLASLSDYVSDVVVYLPESATRIASGRTESPVDPAEWERLVAAYSTDSLVTAIDDELFVVFAHPSPLAGRVPSFVAAAALSSGDLLDLVPAVPEGVGARAWLFGTTAPWRVGSPADESHFTSDPILIEDAVGDLIDTGRSSGFLTEEIGGHRISAAFAYSRTLGASLVWEFATPALVPVRNTLFVFFVILLGVTILGIPVFSFMVYRLVHVPVLELANSLAELESGNLGVHAEYRGRNEFEYLRLAFNSMSSRLSTLFDEVFEQRVHAQEAELRALHAQINPHFLYNSLFVLYRIIQAGKQSESGDFTRNLAQYYEVMTRSTSAEVSLARDVEHSKLYCSIQGVRLGDRVTTHFEPIPHEAGVLPVPRLSFQPIVENCFAHAFDDPEIDGEIRVSVTQVLDRWVVAVEDNGRAISDDAIAALNASMEKLSAAADGKMSALYNVHRRLRLLYGPGGGLTFRRSEHGGLAVLVSLVKE